RTIQNARPDHRAGICRCEGKAWHALYKSTRLEESRTLPHASFRMHEFKKAGFMEEKTGNVSANSPRFTFVFLKNFLRLQQKAAFRMHNLKAALSTSWLPLIKGQRSFLSILEKQGQRPRTGMGPDYRPDPGNYDFPRIEPLLYGLRKL
ncbi:hypothetical protein LZ11_01220, partial [Thermosediminibacter litoriperuensis]